MRMLPPLLTAALAAARTLSAFKGSLVLFRSLLFPFETGDAFPPRGLGFELPQPKKRNALFKLSMCMQCLKCTTSGGTLKFYVSLT